MLRMQDSLIPHLSEPLVKNRESQSCLSMGQDTKARFQLRRRDSVDRGAAIQQIADKDRRADVPGPSTVLPHQAEKQCVDAATKSRPLLRVRAGADELRDRGSMRRGYIFVDARPIVNRRDDASVDAEEIVDVRDRVGGVRSGQVVAAAGVGYQAAEDGLPRAAVDERGMRLHGPSHLSGAAAGPAAARHFCRLMPLTRVLNERFPAVRGAATPSEVQSTEL